MSARFQASLALPDPEAAAAFGRALAPRLTPGDTLLLEGPIGSGKTHIARAIVAARLAVAGRAEDIPSPTYTLVQTYADGLAEIWHADLYRLTDPAEIMELGLDDAFASAIVLIEWPDRLGGLVPPGALRLTLAHHGPGRDLTLFSDDPRWAALLADA